MDNRGLYIDVTRDLEPHELENIMKHPAVIASAIIMATNPDARTKAAEVTATVLEILHGCSAVAALIGCLQVVGILAANMEADAEKTRKRLSLVRVMPV